MSVIPAALAAEFATGATTLCRCWRTVRRDGQRHGFTDHDRDLAFDGTMYLASSGLDATETEAVLGLAVGGGEVAGALRSGVIAEEDVAAGRWDGAAVETWLVDWRDVSRRMLLDVGHIGEIRREGERFSAEIRGLAHALDQPTGRSYTAQCQAELGDARCTVDLAGAGRRLVSAILDVPSPESFTITANAGFAAGTFAGGKVLVGNEEHPVLGHARLGPRDLITLWAPPPAPLAAGQAVTLTVACDRRFATCRDRFANAVNFRGFPHIPGNDFALSYARQGEGGMDGSPLKP
ncbi:MAG: DUF2163 domain-containing protein [Beijerinckiaceae bacterium]